jgi:hypothetical protein
MDTVNNDQESDKNLVNIKESKSDNHSKNFSNIIKQIIDFNNEKFLNGDMNVIEYIISKYVDVEINDIKNLKEITLRVISDYGILNMVGECLPNLIELNLSGSIIPSISDIGSNFMNLRILKVNSCGINNLDGKLY